MTPERRKFNWLPLILQTLVLLGGMFGAVVAYTRSDEHRITALEVKAKVDEKTNLELHVAINKIQETLNAQLRAQERTNTLLDAVEKRHLQEDNRRSR